MHLPTPASPAFISCDDQTPLDLGLWIRFCRRSRLYEKLPTVKFLRSLHHRPKYIEYSTETQTGHLQQKKAFILPRT